MFNDIGDIDEPFNPIGIRGKFDSIEEDLED